MKTLCFIFSLTSAFKEIWSDTDVDIINYRDKSGAPIW